MIKLLNLKDGNLDCYGKSIRDFLNYLRNDISDQLRNCNNDKNYEVYKDFLFNLEEKIKEDDFIKKYFNHNRNNEVLKRRDESIQNLIDLNGFSGNFIDVIFKDNFTNFYIKDILIKNNFESIREKSIDLSKFWFDEVLIDKKGNNKIYLEYKAKKDFIYICFFISNKNENIEEFKIFNDLQKYTEFIIKNISDINLLEINKLNYYYIKLERNIFDKNNDLESKNNYMGKKYGYEIENKISENIIKYLNDKLISEIIFNNKFIIFLESFIPK